VVRGSDAPLSTVHSRLSLAGAAGCLLMVGLAVAVPPSLPAPWSSGARAPLFLGAAWAGFALGVLLVLRLPARTAVALVLLGGLLLPAAAALTPPRSSDDVYRYAWDARVQLAGVDPYRYPPAAPELAGLRDPVLWPATSNWCVPPGGKAADGSPLLPGCTLINRPAVPTIYPPVAQAAFVVARGFGSGPYRPYQLLGVVLASVLTVVLVVGLRRLGHDPRRAVLWAWCPTVALEAANNAHIDVLAALLTVAALLVLARSRSIRGFLVGGALLGLAVATKVTPVLVGPAVARRRPVLLASAAAAAVVAVYAPHVLAVGARVLGYAPGYLREEGYSDGQRFALVTMVVPQRLAGLVAVAILGVVGVVVLLTSEAARPWRGATVMVGAALLVTTPAYPWYALLLVGLVALGGPPAWLAVAAAGYLAQYGQYLGLDAAAGQRIGYGLALLAVLASALVQSQRVPGPETTQAPSLRTAPDDEVVVRPDECSRPVDPSAPG
jgi:Glycosyltransferase family 87